jgi:hypothetical protein
MSNAVVVSSPIHQAHTPVAASFIDKVKGYLDEPTSQIKAYDVNDESWFARESLTLVIGKVQLTLEIRQSKQ